MSSNNNLDQNDQDQSGGYTGYRGNTAKQQRRPYNYSDEGEGQQAQDFGYGTGTRTAGQQQQQQQQQTRTRGQGAYQPPRSAAKGTTPVDATSTSLNARQEALLSYLFGWVTGLIFFVVERKNKYVRFHAIQSFLYFGTFAIVLGLLKVVGGFLGSIFLIGFVLGFIFNIAIFLVGIIVFVSWLYLMLQAYRGKKVQIPYFGKFAERFSR